MKGDPLHPRAAELLAERALRTLDDHEQEELRLLGVDGDDSFDLAAAAVVVATTVLEPMPSALLEQILAKAPGSGTLEWKRTLPGVSMPPPPDSPRDTLVGFANQPPAAQTPAPPLSITGPVARPITGPISRPITGPVARPITGPTKLDPPNVVRMPLPRDSQPFSVETPPHAFPVLRDRSVAPAGLPPSPDPGRRRTSRSILPWLAAAACLLVAGGAVWWASVQPRPGSPDGRAGRAALVASASDVATFPWTVTRDPTAHGATGDVVWSASSQRGYMRFVGLAPNDPAQFQYQLWIFDKTRDQAYPVDGGVFDVTSTGEVIVTINPKLRVNELAMFAVTVEKPGGVVVSKRERIVVTAARS